MADIQPSPEATARQLVVFAVQGEEYALPIAAVREVIRYAPPRSVASSDQSLRGVINLRGAIVPVYDLRPILGVGAPAASGGKIVIAALAESMAGVIVDDVAEVLTIDVEQFEDLPAAANEAVEGVVRHGERLIVILDPQRIVGASPHSEPPAIPPSASLGSNS